MRALMIWLLVGLALPLSAAEDARVSELIAKLPNSTPEVYRPIVRELVGGGEATLNQIIGQVKEPGRGDDRNARYALHALATYAGAPGNDGYRAVFAKATGDAVRNGRAAVVGAFFVQELALAGEPVVGDTLLLNEELGTHVALAVAGAKVTDDRFKAPLASALLIAVQQVPSPSATGDIALAAARLNYSFHIDQLLNNESQRVRIAAQKALAMLGETRSRDGILARADVGDPFERRQSIDAALLLARRLSESDHRGEAEQVYRHLLKTFPDTPHVQCAALRGLAEAAPNEQTLALLLEPLGRGPRGGAFSADQVALQAAALDAARTLPGRYVTRALLKQAQAAPPDLAARVLDTLAIRGDPDAFDGVLGLTRHEDRRVRQAAMSAAAVLGGERALPALIGLLGNEADRAAAQRALAKVPGKGATAAIAYRIPESADGAIRAALLNVLVARGASDQIDFALGALKDESAEVRAAAANAVGALGDLVHIPELLRFLAVAKTEGDRVAAESAILALARLGGDASKQAAGVAAALSSARDPGDRAALLRVLGRLGGAEALGPIRAAVKDNDPAVRDAGVRALVNWPGPDDEALSELLDLAGGAQNNTHRVLALRAYLRLAGQRQLGADRRLAMYRQGLALAKGADEKRLALAGLGDLGDARALPLVAPLLDDEATAQEAAWAVIRVTREFKAPNDELRAVFEKVAKVARDERVKREAERRVRTLGGK